MSIIMEALKKASDRPEIGAVHVSRPVPEAHDFKFSKSIMMMVSTIIIIAAVAYFTGMTKQNSDAGVKNPALAAYSGTDKVAEGYTPSPSPIEMKQGPTPISNLITRLSNPRLTLNGIVYGIGKPAAIIENKIIEEGGSIKGIRVVKIYSDKVEMYDQATGQSFMLKVD